MRLLAVIAAGLLLGVITGRGPLIAGVIALGFTVFWVAVYRFFDWFQRR